MSNANKKTGHALLAEALSKWLENGKETEYSAAAAIGISPSTLSNIKRGLMPNEAQRGKIARAFPAVPVSAWGGKP